MYRDLNNKNIILTGGSGFLGKQITAAFLKNNSNIYILDLKKPNLKSKKIIYFKCDISNEKEVKKVALKLKSKKIDILINNAANDYIPFKTKTKISFENFDIQKWNNDLAVGLGGAFLCTKIFGSIMAKKKAGVILNISSDLGIIAPDQSLYKDLKFEKPVTYSVVKHGLNGLTKYAAAYWANKNVRCNAIAPGGIINNQNVKFLNKIKKIIPMGRLAKKNEYNNLILFLCSEQSSYMTGSIVVADGAYL